MSVFGWGVRGGREEGRGGKGLSMGGNEEVCLEAGMFLLGCRNDDDADGGPFLCSYHTILRKGEGGWEEDQGDAQFGRFSVGSYHLYCAAG